MNILIIVLGAILISALLAWWSLRDFQGENKVQEIKEKHTKEQIKGGIVFDDDQQTKHYSSYS